jgi:hypothetical protein
MNELNKEIAKLVSIKGQLEKAENAVPVDDTPVDDTPVDEPTFELTATSDGLVEDAQYQIRDLVYDMVANNMTPFDDTEECIEWANLKTEELLLSIAKSDVECYGR